MRRVLVPLDGSPLAESILPDARRLAGPGGGLVLMRDATCADGDDAGAAEDYLERLAETLRSPDLSVETHTVTTGDPAVAIDIGAQAYRSDMIALATHGRSQAQRTWWGNVAWRAALRSPVPVLLRHADRVGTQEEGVSERRIMVPLDGSKMAEKALPLARDLAREWGGGLWLVRVISNAEDDPAAARQYLAQVEKEGDMHVEVLVGPAVESLAGAVHRFGITDVVLTSNGSTGVSRAIVGEVADNLIQRLHQPVVVIPPPLHIRLCHAGSAIRKQAPCPGSDSTLTVPPCASTRRRQMARPSPWDAPGVRASFMGSAYAGGRTPVLPDGVFVPFLNWRDTETMPSSRSRRRRARSASAAPSASGIDYRALTYVGSVPGLAVLPLRLFLGLTFVYAGLQKITDPGFFTPGSRTYIGTQIISFARGSPIHFLLIHFAEHAVFFGILTILMELMIGAAVLLGLFTRLAALGGLALNMVFFLSASWNIYPYFLGADVVFVMCWLTLAIAGPGGLSLDAALREPMSKRLSPELRRVLVGPVAAPPDGEEPPATPAEATAVSGGLLTRREAVVALAVTVGVVLLGVIPRGGPSGQVAATGNRGKSPSTPPSRGGTPASNVPPGSIKVGNVSQLPANSALVATDPKSGDPAVVVHTSGSQIVAYDAVCTHAGCTVQYDASYKLLVCPCHGGAFDPVRGAQVVGGPPPAPLTSLPINIDSKGNIFLS